MPKSVRAPACGVKDQGRHYNAKSPLVKSACTVESAAYNRAPGRNPTDPRSNSGSRASHSTTYSTNESSSWGRASGWSEALLPVLEEMPTTVFSLEEQIHRSAADIRNLRRRQAVVKIPERKSAQVTIPMVEEGYARAERVERFERETFRRSPFAATAGEVDERLAARRADLETQAQLAVQDQPVPEAPEDFLE